MGPAGAGLTFVYKTGNPGPALTSGTYVVVAKALVPPFPGVCSVVGTGVPFGDPLVSGFSQSFDLSPAFDLSPGGTFRVSFVGVVVVTASGSDEVELSCWLSDAPSFMSSFKPDNVEWWIAPTSIGGSGGGGGGGGFGS
jgi:hypothetical protein